MIRAALTHWRNSGALIRLIHKKCIDNTRKHGEFVHLIRLFGIGQVNGIKISTLRSIGRYVLSACAFDKKQS